MKKEKRDKSILIVPIMVLAAIALLYFSVKGQKKYESLAKTEYTLRVTFSNMVTDTITIKAPEGTKFGVGKHMGLSSKDDTNLYMNRVGPFSLVAWNVTHAKVISSTAE
jgi:hypothetical protein